MLFGHNAVVAGQIAHEILTTDIYAFGPDGWLKKGRGSEKARFDDSIIREFRRRGGDLDVEDMEILAAVHALLCPEKAKQIVAGGAT